MVTIYVEKVTEKSKEVAREVADILKMTVRLVTPTEIVEVHHEKVSEGQTQEDKEVQGVQEVQEQTEY